MFLGLNIQQGEPSGLIGISLSQALSVDALKGIAIEQADRAGIVGLTLSQKDRDGVIGLGVIQKTAPLFIMVQDASGNAIQGATITIKDGIIAPLSAMSDSSGKVEFDVTGFDAVTTIKITHPNYQTYRHVWNIDFTKNGWRWEQTLNKPIAVVLLPAGKAAANLNSHEPTNQIFE